MRSARLWLPLALTLFVPGAARAYDDDELEFRVVGFSADGHRVVYEESFTRGHIGGGHVRLVVYSARSGKVLRRVTVVAHQEDPATGETKIIVSEAAGKRRRRKLLRRYGPRPGKALSAIKELEVTFRERGPRPELPADRDGLTGKESRRVVRTWQVKRAGRQVATRQQVLRQRPAINSHTGIPSWSVMSLKSGQLSPDGQTLALVMNTGDADRDTAAVVLRLVTPAKWLKARGKRRPNKTAPAGAKGQRAPSPP